MATVEKIDGLASGPQGSEQVFASRKKFISLNAYADDGADVTYTKGDAVAIETNTGAGYEITVAGVATNAATYFGVGNMAILADSAKGSHDGLTFGVVAETVTISAGKWQPISIQVAGIASCNVDGSVAAGDKLNISSTAGRLELMSSEDVDVTHAVAIALEADTANFADCYLLNPLQL